MNPWKILGGAVIGIGAVAATPFTGGGSLLGAATLVGSLSGAGTIAAAVGAGAVGAGVGAKLSSDEEKEKQKAEEESAELRAKAEKMEKELVKITNTFNQNQQYFDLVIAMTAVGLACANADDEIADKERECIGEFISGISNSFLPEDVKEKINTLYQNPPRLRRAFDLVLKVKAPSYDLFDHIIDITIDADGVEHEKEIEFKQDWEQLKRIS